MSNKHIISGSLAIERLDGQTWEEAFRADPRFWRLRKAQRTALLTLAKKKDKQATSTHSASKPLSPPPETPFIIPEGMTPEEATREKVRRDAELYPITTTTPLKDLPLHELSLLEKWMVPPSRRQELREYQAELRRRAIASRDSQAASKLNSKPGERCSDPRGYWTRNHHGNPLAGNQRPSPSQAPSRRESREPLVSGSLVNKDSGSEPDAIETKARIQPQESCIADQKYAPPGRSKEVGNSACNEVGQMNSRQLQDCLLLDEFDTLPEALKKAVTDRYLMLEGGVTSETFWQDYK